MKFIVDAHLSYRLKNWLTEKGYDCEHTSDLPLGNDTDDMDIINHVDIEDRIVVTKDSDFYNHNLLYGRPRRILLITTGNISNRDLIRLLDANFLRIKDFFERGDEVVEINNSSIYIHK